MNDILDCTFRDGGYYGLWNFDSDLVQRAILTSSAAGVKMIEVGFRFPEVPQDGRFFGKTAFTTDSYLAGFIKPPGVQFGVMVNEADYADVDILDHFPQQDDSPVDFVRVATRLEQVDRAGELVNSLSNLGYQVWLNLMSAHSVALEDFKLLVAAAHGAHGIYLADSNGSMHPNEVRNKMEALSSAVIDTHVVGFHAHDNLGLALANSLVALESGASIVDGTYLGMGRGAGNTPLELLIGILRPNLPLSSLASVGQLVEQDFSNLRDTFGWGTNSRFRLGGALGIHPNRVIEIDESPSLDHATKLAKIKALSERASEGGAADFRTDPPAIQISKNQSDGGFEDLRSFVNYSSSDRPVLLLGPGNTKKDYFEELRAFISSSNPLVLSLGQFDAIQKDLTECHVEANPMRMLDPNSEFDDTPIIFPKIVGLPGAEAMMKQKNGFRLDFDVVPGDRVFIEQNRIKLPGFRNSFYAFSVALALEAKEVILAGFDGFGRGDPRDVQLQQIINNLAKEGQMNFSTATPSSLMLRQSSWVR